MQGRLSRFSLHLLFPLSLCLSLLECSSPTGFAQRVNHVLYSLNTHLHSEGSLACAAWPGHNQSIHRYHAFKGCGGQTSSGQEGG